MADETIGIIPLGLDEPVSLPNLADSLRVLLAALLPASYRLEFRQAQPAPLPVSAFDPRRRMYSADILINELSGMKNGWTKVLGLTSRDLHQGTWSHVTGAARIDRAAAVLSTARLGTLPGRTGRRGILFDRIVKEAAHEIGHLYGLPHCPDPLCLMHLSGAAAETDRKHSGFCRTCTDRARLRLSGA